jgi:type I restriction enzyme S subunit
MSIKLPHYPKYKNSGVKWLGEVPEHWDIAVLKRMAHTELSNIDKKTAEGETSVKLCNYLDVYRNQTITSNLEFMAASASKEQIARLSLRQGDVIITKDSETPDDIGVPALVADNMDGVVCGYHLALLRTYPHVASGSYLACTLRSAFLRAQFSTSAVGITRFALGKYKIENVIVPKPPIEEQTKIAKFLDIETKKVDALIEEQRRLIDLLKEKRQAAIFHAVTKGLNPNTPMNDSGIEWLGEVPKHWKLKKLRHFANVIRGKFTHRPRNDPAFYDGDFPFVQTGDITGSSRYITEFKQTLNARGASVSKEFPRGTLVMAIAANIGDVAILDFPAYFPDSIVGMVPHKGVELMFMYYLLIGMKQPMLMTSTISTQMNLNVNKICSLTSSCPPKDEQREIVSFLDKALEKMSVVITEATLAIEMLQERRSALISAAITGQVDVRNFRPQEASAVCQ